MTLAPSDLPELVLVEDCADDELMSLRAISRIGIPCRVTVKRDGMEALDHLLAQDSRTPSLIVLDYMLPRLNGLEVLTRLREHEKLKFVPIVIFSGTNEGAELAECYRVGVNSCVAKPVDAEQYLDRLSWIVRYWLTVNLQSDEAI